MRKRAALARALALDPTLLFLDEPGSGLDPVNAARLDELILNLRDHLGTTVVMVTHEIDSVFAVADRVLFLDEVEKTMTALDAPQVLALVERGLSAQLATQSLLTGQLYIDLDLRAGGKPARRTAEGVVEIPTTLTRFQSLQDQLDRVDLTRITQDLTATLSAVRGLLAGPELKQTMADLALATAALARLSATLDKKAGPLVDAAQGTLAQTGRAADRVGTAADRVTRAADTVGSAASSAQAALASGSPLMSSVQQAADELGRSAAALRAATADDSATVQGMQRAMADVSRAARAVRELSDAIEQQPQSLLRGRPAAP
jgi:paraquat-inducible protein B